MDWQRLRLDELGTVARGKSRHRPRNDPALYDGKWPFFQTGDVKAAELHLRAFSQTYNDAGLAQSKLWPLGTLCITIAANIAETAILAIPGCFPDSIVGFRANPARADVRYIKYLIDTLKLGMQNASRGTTQDNLSLDKLLSFQMSIPPVSDQHRIASILSNYDDLIENNTRRIAILEEMARRIYEEWFVRFRFPGRENVRMVESELGPAPEGWRVQGLYDIAELTYGFPFKSKLFRSVVDGSGVIRIRDINGNRTNTYTTESADQKYRVRNGDILVGMDGEFHMGCWAGGEAWLNQRVVRFRPREGIPQSWLFLTARGPIKVLESTIVGTTVAHLSAKDLKEMRIVVPDPKVLERAGEALEPLFDLALTLKLANTNLRTTRDLLLPKLVSGELDVSALPESEAVAA